MSCGRRIRPADLALQLQSLDIDEGIRIESLGIDNKEKIFINKNASGIFVLQMAEVDRHRNDMKGELKPGKGWQSHDKILYFDSPAEVLKTIRQAFGKKIAVWLY
jgi:hypothetical protein